ncbi:MAG TPA: AGE family epimerase/isomerase [Spirochaetia bacterium]|nr:AGE family epimerase/isomerase [Spirochaetia bacterium]
MNPKRIHELRAYFRDRLINDTLAFWVEHAIDTEMGGFTFFLDRQGRTLSTDKPMWSHGRAAWLFARLYNELEPRKEWLDLSRHAVDFLRRFGFADDGRVFYSVTRDGRPLRRRRYLFAETFAIIGLAEYARAAGDAGALGLARSTLELVRDHLAHARLPPKVNPATRRTRGHSMAMIQVNTLQVLRQADPDPKYDSMIDSAIDELFRCFVHPERAALFETVGPEGELLLDLPEGRCINPGHAIETAWFLMAEGRRRGDRHLIERALPILEWSLDLGWDKRDGGLFSFVDIDGHQPDQLEWDMKLWWPHTEAIYATLLAHHLTGENRYLEWFEKVLAYAIGHFPDPEHGEWFGYLHRDGTVALDLKGNMWKGLFHLPRQQLNCYLLLTAMAK